MHLDSTGTHKRTDAVDRLGSNPKPVHVPLAKDFDFFGLQAPQMFLETRALSVGGVYEIAHVHSGCPVAYPSPAIPMAPFFAHHVET
jgi:hypothetical protein